MIKRLITGLTGLVTLLVAPINVDRAVAGEHYVPGTGVRVETSEKTVMVPKIVPGEVLYTHDYEGNRLISPVRKYNVEMVPETRTRINGLSYDEEKALWYKGLKASKNWRPKNPFGGYNLRWVDNEHLPENYKRIWGGRLMWILKESEPAPLNSQGPVEYTAPSKLQIPKINIDVPEVPVRVRQPTLAPKRKSGMVDTPTVNPRNSIYGGDPSRHTDIFR